MSFSDVLNVLAAFGATAYLVVEIRAHRKQKAMFERCGERLGIEGYTHTLREMSGKIRGMPLEVRFVSGDRYKVQHTTIEVAFAPCAVLLELRKQDASEEREVRERRAVDLTVGDPALDQAWIIEGAPPERVKRMLSDASLRAQLAAFAEIDGATLKVEDGKVSLYKLGSEVGADAIATDRIELCLALAEAAVADAKTPLDHGEVSEAGSDYRAAPRTDELEGAAKIAELKSMRAARRIAQLRLATLVTMPALSVAAAILPAVTAGPALAVTAPVLLAVAALSAAILWSYRDAKKSAPTVPDDPVLVRCFAACWAINLALVARAIARL
jgi:hypothetical protein